MLLCILELYLYDVQLIYFRLKEFTSEQNYKSSIERNAFKKHLPQFGPSKIGLHDYELDNVRKKIH